MRYNPCGHIVDWARAPYTQECRFFRDDDRTSTVRWFQAEPDAQPLTFPSAICVSTNEIDRYIDSPIGEVYGTWHKFKIGTAPNGLYTGHVCGTEQDFAEGCKYEPDLPEVQYLANGFPSCCDPPFTALGGAGGGGLARFSVLDPFTPGNSCATAGTASLNTTYNNGPFFGAQWYRFTVVPFAIYYLTVTSGTAGAHTATPSWGTSCSTRTTIGTFTTQITRLVVSAQQVNMWIEVLNAPFGGGTYSLKLEDH